MADVLALKSIMKAFRLGGRPEPHRSLCEDTSSELRQRLRVGIVAVERRNSAASGGHRYAVAVVRALQSSPDVEVVLAANPRDRALFEGLQALPSPTSATFKPVRLVFEHPLVLAAWYAFMVSRFRRRFRLDLVHIVAARPTLERRALQTLHDTADMRMTGKYDLFRTQYRQRVLYPLLRRAPLVLTVSGSAKDDIVGDVGIDRERVRVVENMDPGIPVLPRSTSPNPFFLVVGRIDHPSKNLILLIDAFENYCALGGTHRLVFAGADSFGSDLVHRRIRSSSVRQRIDTLGYVPDDELAELYAAATALCFPSLHEGFGLPAIEAVKRGLPVLFSDGGALPEVMGTTVGMLPTRDPHAWCTELLAVQVSPERLKELRNAQAASSRHQTLEKMARELRQAYCEFLGPK